MVTLINVVFLNKILSLEQTNKVESLQNVVALTVAFHCIIKVWPENFNKNVFFPHFFKDWWTIWRYEVLFKIIVWKVNYFS